MNITTFNVCKSLANKKGLEVMRLDDGKVELYRDGVLVGCTAYASKFQDMIMKYGVAGHDTKERIQYLGIDNNNRPVFKSLEHPRNFFGSLDKLFPHWESEESVLKTVSESDLVFFGCRFNCEPMGTSAHGVKIVRSSEV